MYKPTALHSAMFSFIAYIPFPFQEPLVSKSEEEEANWGGLPFSKIVHTFDYYTHSICVPLRRD